MFEQYPGQVPSYRAPHSPTPADPALRGDLAAVGNPMVVPQRDDAQTMVGLPVEQAGLGTAMNLSPEDLEGPGLERTLAQIDQGIASDAVARAASASELARACEANGIFAPGDAPPAPRFNGPHFPGQ